MRAVALSLPLLRFLQGLLSVVAKRLGGLGLTGKAAEQCQGIFARYTTVLDAVMPANIDEDGREAQMLAN